MEHSISSNNIRCTQHSADDAAHQVFCHINPSELWDIDPVVAYGEFIVGQIKGLPRTFLALEARVARLAACFTALEEIFEGCRDIHEGPLDGTLRDLIRPGELLATYGMKLRAQFERRRFFPSLVPPLPFSDGPVEAEACGPSSLGKVGRLFWRWVQPNFVGANHAPSLLSYAFASIISMLEHFPQNVNRNTDAKSSSLTTFEHVFNHCCFLPEASAGYGRVEFPLLRKRVLHAISRLSPNNAPPVPLSAAPVIFAHGKGRALMMKQLEQETNEQEKEDR